MSFSMLSAVAIFGILGVAIANAAGPLGLVIWAAVSVLGFYVSRIVRRRKRRQHQELWDGWDGRED